ncbi:tannase/feruloyl esterase family alpha/beta hydrolase [Streptomyces polygonati]|uniref:Tannase/feruloyl esterase family alpha/beta hydrolase n=1 Tax=Streptomyces polygonati TaxID=1617087 RepID=A0ABV8HSN5_9ACTN
MKPPLVALMSALALSVLLPVSAGAVTPSPKPAAHPAQHGCAQPHVAAPAGAVVESVTASHQPGGTVTFPAVPPLPAPPPAEDVPAYCDITVTLTHPGAHDYEHLRIWLPDTGWTGRFQAVGGSAYAAGDFGSGLAAAIKGGYAAATTDAGVTPAYLDVGAWALDPDGTVNKPLLKDFASRSQHDLAVVGKEVTAEVYGRPVGYSYFNGCSTGGRQGYMEAQRYAGDYDGILADAPGTNWDEFEVATLWPQVVMNQEHTFPTSCEFSAFTDAAVKACDTLDGAPDGLIAEPENCAFDPRRLIGRTVVCDGETLRISAADAEVVRKIWDGPTSPSGRRLWYGIPVGASFDGLAGTRTNSDGTRSGTPFDVPAIWVSTFVAHQPAFDTSAITYRRFAEIFRQSQEQYDGVIGTDDPDLSAFREAGGKLLTYHGDADQYIPTQGTVDYRRRVDRLMGGTKKVDDFYRLFLAPGVGHCGESGTGPVPTDPLGALTNWVEHGKAPDTLPAATTDATGRTISRDLCRYPLISRYDGHGDPAAATSYRCAAA